MHPSHPLASRTKLKLQDFADHAVALLDDTHATRRLLDQALVSQDVALRTVLTVNQIGLAVAFARAGQAMTFAPRHIVGSDVETGVLKTVLIDSPALLATRFVLCRHKTRPPTLPAEAFLVALRRQFAALDREVHRERRGR